MIKQQVYYPRVGKVIYVTFISVYFYLQINPKKMRNHDHSKFKKTDQIWKIKIKEDLKRRIYMLLKWFCDK